MYSSFIPSFLAFTVAMASPTDIRSASTASTADVVVIGAGLSGLQTAVNIQAAGYSCVVLEAIDRVGGKVLSIKSSSNSHSVDVY